MCVCVNAVHKAQFTNTAASTDEFILTKKEKKKKKNEIDIQSVWNERIKRHNEKRATGITV